MSFATFNAHSSPLFFKNKILKFPDIVSLENCIFVRNCFVNNAFSIFLNLFKLVSDVHSYSTTNVTKNLFFVAKHNTKLQIIIIIIIIINIYSG